MMPANVPFSKADLASQVLRMCPYQWQDQYQYNLQEKGMTPMDMQSLFKLLLRLLSTCVPPRKPMCNPSRKLLTKNEAGAKRSVLEPQSRLPRKFV
jgi:hypothetical protein